MSNNIYLPALIGIAGTILGVLLGWFLNYLSKKGKLKLFINSFEYKYFTKGNQYGDMISQDEITKETSMVTLKIQFDFYNASNESAIVRDLYFSLHFDQEIKKRFSVREYNPDSIKPFTFNDLLNLNIPPKTILSFNSEITFSQKEIGIINKSENKISYRDRRNKIIIHKINHNRP